MKILITGSSGFIGSHLFHELSKQHEIWGISRKKINLPNTIIADLLNYEELLEVIHSNNIQQIDIIIHTAAILANSSNLHDIEVLNKNNILSKNIACLAQVLNVQQIINISSIAVYPNIDGLFSETSLINPAVNNDGIYGLAKFNSEQIINAVLRNTLIQTSHLRVAYVYGPGMDATRLIPVMEKELKETNTITLFGNGEREISIISLSSLLQKIKIVIEKKLAGIYNVSDENISTEALALRLIAQNNIKEAKLIKKEQGIKPKFNIDTTKFDTACQ